MKTYKVRLVCSHWYEKTIEAETPEEAKETAVGDTFKLSEWQYKGEGEAEIYEIKEIKNET